MFSFSESAVRTSQGSDLVPGLQEALGKIISLESTEKVVFWTTGEIQPDTYSQRKDHTKHLQALSLGKDQYPLVLHPSKYADSDFQYY